MHYYTNLYNKIKMNEQINKTTNWSKTNQDTDVWDRSKKRLES